MKNKYIILSFLTFSALITNAQTDTLRFAKSETLSELVIYSDADSQSIKNSVNNVKVISSEDIKNLGAVNLGDVLNQYMNINVNPSSSSGKSKISMFGLDASYFKILIDNIPAVSEEGFGNNIDLSQININDIERIEIVEGSMGVTHGANAVSGILNIITKKNIQTKWDISAGVQEETIGKEYKPFSEGRHIQMLNVKHKINDHWFVGVSGLKNDFQGFKGDLLGENHNINNGKRGYKWLPKDQIQTNAVINYNKNNFRIFYRFEYLNDQVKFFDSAVDSGYNENIGEYKYGNDERYFTNRFAQHLNAIGSFSNGMNYNISLSNQSQKREIETFRNNITHHSETNNNRYKDQSMDVWYSIGTLTNLFKSNIFNPTIEYEWTNNKGFSIVDEEGSGTKSVSKNIDNLDFYASSDVKINSKFTFKPGFRYSFQSLFDNQNAYSLGLLYKISDGLESRTSFGKSYRTPNFNELYSKMVFDGHYFVGNENLIPERSSSLQTSLKKTTYFKSSDMALSNQIQFGFIEIKDRITSALTRFEGATPKYEYINISKYKNFNIVTSNNFQWDNFNFNLGGSFSWLSQKIDNLEYSTSDKFLFTYSLQANASYFLENPQLTFAVYYKYISKSPQWIVGSNEYVLSSLDAYNWLDISVRKTFFDKQLEATIGARNLFNVGSLNQTRVNEGAGHTVDSQVMMAYGTSYFLKLTYNLKIK
ncbi:TonB-dependent receptor plug domain-containing protein [Flavobacterium sp. I3-2]|uniref:TonB-dependent receptor plug domain-containing protein n=1 Tax=Flavobacterium sp. I3-2 TaxID=2748319 RepID=UPI0015B183F3|nr:TonB-dependent receptor [Flavobacterium sp. I3-2]